MAIILVGIILYAIGHYISISHTLRRVINFSDEERFDANFVEAWNLTYDLKTSVMTKSSWINTTGTGFFTCEIRLFSC